VEAVTMLAARIAPAVAEAVPDFAMSIHVFGEVRDEAIDEAALVRLQQAALEAPAARKRADAIICWKQIFAMMGARSGVKSSVQLLDGMLERRGAMPRINPRVDCYNAISATFGVPMGGYDLSQLDADLSLQRAEAGMPFTGLGMDESEPTRAGEIIYASRGRVVCRYWNYKDAAFSAIGPETGALCFVADLLADHAGIARETHEALADALEKILGVKHDMCDLIGAGVGRLATNDV
jgi:DNA/RNA-binding domain of Phe-tRNA-synthetase-like protein